MELTINILAFEGERVQVLNTKKTPSKWESGKVSHIEIKVDGNKKLWAQYRVILDRQSKVRRRGVVIYATTDRIHKPKEN